MFFVVENAVWWMGISPLVPACVDLYIYNHYFFCTGMLKTDLQSKQNKPSYMETSKIYRKYTIIFVVLLIYAALITALIVWLFNKDATASTLEKLQSPPVIILAIVISVLTFTISSAVFSAIGKSKSNTPLGMPDGSIRALIALSLITLFFILATQIYARVSEGGIGKLERVSDASLKDISVKDIISKEKTDSVKNTDVATSGAVPFFYFYKVTLKVTTNSDAADMAKNIIASFTALIATICGFYFGSAANRPTSDSNSNNTDTAKITPKSLIPTAGTKGVLMTFEWDVTPSGQGIEAVIISDTSQPIVDPINSSRFTYTPNTTGKVTLKVHLKSNPSISQSYTITISE